MGKRDYYYLTHNSSKQIITHNFFLKEQKNYILTTKYKKYLGKAHTVAAKQKIHHNTQLTMQSVNLLKKNH
jgi:hypothetical protein